MDRTGEGTLGTVLVTGASGLLGANLALTAVGRAARVVGVVHRHPVRLPGVEMRVRDLTESGSVRDLLRSVRPNWVLHCAALTDVDRCEDHPNEAWRLNVDASRVLAEAAREVDAGIVYVSTDSVFRGDRGNYGEDDPTGPVNRYARSKLEGEMAVAAANPRHLILRTNIFGWNARDKQSLSEWVLGRLQRGEEVPGFRDVWFNPLLVNDLADLILELVGRESTGVMHAAAADRCSKYEFARTVAEVFGWDAELVRPTSVADVAFRAPRPSDTTLDTGRLTSTIGRSSPTIRAGLERFLFLREQGLLDRLRGVAHATGTER